MSGLHGNRRFFKAPRSQRGAVVLFFATLLTLFADGATTLQFHRAVGEPIPLPALSHMSDSFRFKREYRQLIVNNQNSAPADMRPEIASPENSLHLGGQRKLQFESTVEAYAAPGNDTDAIRATQS
jgi:hypothetical protein